MARYQLRSPRLHADFNGYFGDLLCLSHGDTCQTEHGEAVELREGMIVTAYDPDANEAGERDDLIATGIVEPSPEWLRCRGSRWCLRIDENGLRSESDIPPSEKA
ncbi:hypothetical protein OKA05_28610 [Luteolibacter arcticus]|uniref:Uncharacterized protein n=1 Tax=Luteolibacter arcticus TaxID=1581411 RepID=A0ABT3GSP0_9BACT|nr:hypothetical protein [Luteolibacter arcticus]MCW1926548.1 hypothetical protein [Luteolibacter arcticus]